MKVIFYKAINGNFVDKLIAWYTSTFKQKLNGKWKNTFSHCELLFTDGSMFSASQYDNAVRFKYHVYNPTVWEYVNLDSFVMESEIKTKTVKLIGKPYDYFGVLAFIGFGKQKNNAWYCSEIVAHLLGLNNTQISPNELYNKLTNV